MSNNDQQFKEEDIQSAIRYLKIHRPDKATREQAIKLLESMEDRAHFEAHRIVENRKSKKVKKNSN